MDHWLNWNNGSQLIAAAVLAVIALGTWRAAPKRMANRFFAAFLLLVAANFTANFLFAYFVEFGDRGVAFSARRIAEPFLLMDPIILLYFASLFPVRRGMANHPALAALAMLAPAGLTFWMFQVPNSDLGTSTSVYGKTRDIYLVVCYVTSLTMMAFAWLRETDAVRSNLLRYLVIAFAVMVIPRVGATTATFGFGFGVPNVIVTAVMFVAFFVPFVLFSGQRRQEATEIMGWSGLLVLLVAFTWFPVVFGFETNVGVVFASRWLVFGGLVSYAILRYDVFDIDLRFRRGIALAAAAALVVGAFIVVRYLTLELAGDVGPLPVALGALGAAVAIVPAALVARASANALLPKESERSEFLHRRKMEVYSLALTSALEEGRDVADDAALLRLRADLGLSLRDHKELLAIAQSELRIGHQSFAPFRRGAMLGERYRIGDQIGEGRHGRTYRAEAIPGAQPVAVKELRPEWAGDVGILRRFDREARILAETQHPNLVGVVDRFEASRSPCIVLEWMDDGNLHERLRAGALEHLVAIDIADRIGGALEALHAKGVVHRDVKPANILFHSSGVVKLGDLGVAHVEAHDEALTIATASGTQPGTLAYMSPEQARGDDVDERTDVYALGAVLYEMLTAKPPIDVAGVTEYEAKRRVQEISPRLDHPYIPKPLRACLDKALAKQADDRYPSMAAMRKAIAHAQRA